MPKKNSKTVLPDPLPNGEVLQDIAKKKWILGPSIGVGGFGEIYSAAEYEGKKSSNYQFVVKIEPHGNGPLFCEMHFFMRNAKPDMIKTWCSENKVPSLGMPRYLGSGSHEHKGKKYRFLVMDRYGEDLWHIFLKNKKEFPISTVYRISLQLLDVLEYIHNNGYVHADIKGANILLGLSKPQNQVFLVDFGLASHYTKKDFKPDPKKAHNGTIEYTSRDAHEGVPTRRGDIEILAYNMVQWMGTVLPWEKNLSDPVAVHNSKKKYMEDTKLFLNTCFAKKKVPSALKEFLEYVTKMDYNTEPDYKKLRNILTKGVKSEGDTLTGALDFKTSAKHKAKDDDKSETPEKKRRLSPKQKQIETKRRGKIVVQEISDESESESESDSENMPVNKSRKNSEKPKQKQVETKRRGKTVVQEISDESESESESDSENIPVNKSRKTSEKPVANGYNAEMLRLQKKIAERNAGKKKNVKKSGSSSSGNDLASNFDPLEDDVIEATPPERLVVKKRTKANNTPTVNGTKGDSEELTPRTLRQRRRENNV